MKKDELKLEELKREFNLLQRTYVTGLIDYDEFCLRVDTELEYTDGSGVLWKFDEVTGQPFRYDEKAGVWMEDEKAGKALAAATAALIPSSEAELGGDLTLDAVPDEIYKAWAGFVKKAKTAANAKESMEKSIKKPAETTAPKPIKEENRKAKQNFCKQCGKSLKPENKFCTGCGVKLV
jgi:hypothetical protein